MKTKTIHKSWLGGEEAYEVNHLNKKHGLYKCWWFNGNITDECTFQNGQIHGLYKKWNPNGTFQFLSTNKKGEIFGTRIDFEILITK